MTEHTHPTRITLHPASAPLKGRIRVPGDKSISHRAVMFGALSEGETRIRGFLRGADCLSTISCFRQLGIPIDESGDEIIVHGKGLWGLRAPESVLDTGNSGTTMRLMSGILSGQRFDSELTGDASIRKRPMNRVITPLTMMGASIASRSGNGCAPLVIRGWDTPAAENVKGQVFPEPGPRAVPDLPGPGPGHGKLRGITYTSPVASAQVKSCVLLAGLYAEGETTVIEPAPSRDHTERMLRGFGARVDELPSGAVLDGLFSDTGTGALPSGAHAVRIRPEPALRGMDITVPGDISSAAYFIAAALLVPGSELLIENVGVNPTRDGILTVVRAMGGDVSLLQERLSGGEPVADILVRSSALRGTQVSGDIIPSLIDELPVIAVLAAFAEGTTVIADAAELRVKESDRIAAVCEGLQAMGADVEPTGDGMIIHGRGPDRLRGALIDSRADHRIAMSFAAGALAARGETTILGAECVSISYPHFFRDLQSGTRCRLSGD